MLLRGLPAHIHIHTHIHTHTHTRRHIPLPFRLSDPIRWAPGLLPQHSGNYFVDGAHPKGWSMLRSEAAGRLDASWKPCKGWEFFFAPARRGYSIPQRVLGVH